MALGSISLNMFWNPSIKGSSFLQASMKGIHTYATKLDKVNILGATKFPLLNRQIKQLDNHLGKIRSKTAKISANPIKLDIKTSRTSLKEARKDMNAIEHDAKQVAFWTKKSSENLRAGATAQNKSMHKKAKSSQIGGGAIVGAVATASLITLPFKASINFESNMANVKALTKNITSEDFALLTAKAKELGKTTEWSASQSALGMSYLAKAGFDAKQQLGAMSGVLGLATAGSVDLGVASDIGSNILSGFSIKAEKMGMVSDILAKTFTTSNTDLNMLGETMGYVAPIASGLGVGLSEVSALAGKLGDVGIQGSMAGTSLRQMYTRLSAPPTEARKALNALGVSVFDAKGKFKGMPNIIGELNKSMVGMSDESKTEKLKHIFGMTALSSGIALMKVGKKGLLDYKKTLDNSSGTTKKIQIIKLATTEGHFKLLASAIEGLNISATNGLLPTIKIMSNVLKSGAERLDKFTQKFPEASKWIFGLGAAFIIGSVALAGFGFVASGVGAGLALLASPVTAIVLGLVAIGAGAVYLYNKFDGVRSAVDGFFSGFFNGMSPLVNEFKNIFVQIGSSVKSVFSSIGSIFSAFGSVLGAVGISFSGVGGLIAGVFKVALFPIKMVFKVVSWVASGIKGLFSGLSNAISPTLNQTGLLIGEVKSSFMALFSTLKPLFSFVGSVLGVVFSPVIEMFGWIKGGLSSIGISFESVGSVIGSVVGGIFNLVAFPIKMTLALMSGVLDMGKMVIDGWVLIWQGAVMAWNGVINIISSIGVGIKNTFIAMFNWSPIGLIVNNWGKIGGYFRGIANSIKKPFVSFFDWIGSKFKAVFGLIDKAKSIVNAPIDAVKGGASKLWSGTKSFFGFGDKKEPIKSKIPKAGVPVNNVDFKPSSLKEAQIAQVPLESVSDVTAGAINETKSFMQNNTNNTQGVNQNITNHITVHAPAGGQVDYEDLKTKLAMAQRELSQEDTDLQMQDAS